MTDELIPPIPEEGLEYIRIQISALRDAFSQIYPDKVLIVAAYVGDQSENSNFSTTFTHTSCTDTQICSAVGFWAQRMLNPPDEDELEAWQA